MDGPEEATRESAWPEAKLQQNAAVWIRKGTSFCGGVVPRLYFFHLL